MTVEVPDGVYRGQRSSIAYEAAFGYHGPMNIELIAQSSRAPSVYRETLDRTGPGFHHFMIRTDDYDRALERYSKMGIAAAFEAELPGSGRWSYLDARAQIGSFIELYDMQPAVAQMWSLMEEAHRTWDGKNPVRSITDLG